MKSKSFASARLYPELISFLLSMKPDEETAKMAKRLLRLNEERMETLEMPNAGDPVWRMLLALYYNNCEGRGISVSSLALYSNVPATTALRHIESMERTGVIQRFPDPTDLRRSFLFLSEDTGQKMHQVLAKYCETLPSCE